MSTEDIYTIQDKAAWTNSTLLTNIMDYLCGDPSALRGCVRYLKQVADDEAAE